MVASEEVTLTGFVGDYRGTKNGLSFFRPVVEIDGASYVALANQWTQQDLREIGPDDHRYVQPTPEVEVEWGDGVWLVGQIFVNRCTDVEGYGNRLKVWRSFNSEYRFSTGPLARFVELNQQIYAAAVRLMHKALFEPGDLGKAQRIFEVLNNLHYTSVPDQHVQRGLFYSEARQMDRYEMVKADAVLDGVVADGQGFDAKVQELAAKLRARRLREEVASTLPPSPAGYNPSVPTPTDVLQALLRGRTAPGDFDVSEFWGRDFVER